MTDRAALYCSFCGKSQQEVTVLIAGPVVFICDECVDLCTTIVKEAREGQEAAKQVAAPSVDHFVFAAVDGTEGGAA